MYTYDELKAMSVPAPHHPIGDETGSYTGSPLGDDIGLHTHHGLHSVHVIVGYPAYQTVAERKLAVVEHNRTDVLLSSLTVRQAEILAQLPRPHVFKGDDPRYLFHV